MTRLACALGCLVVGACGSGTVAKAIPPQSIPVVSLLNPAAAASSQKAPSVVPDVPDLQEIPPPQLVACRWKGRAWSKGMGTWDLYPTPLGIGRMDILPLRHSRIDASLTPDALYLQFENAYARLHGWTRLDALTFRPAHAMVAGGIFTLGPSAALRIRSVSGSTLHVAADIDGLTLGELNVVCDDLLLDPPAFDVSMSSAVPAGGAMRYLVKGPLPVYAGPTSRTPVASLQIPERMSSREPRIRYVAQLGDRARVVWRHPDGVLVAWLPASALRSSPDNSRRSDERRGVDLPPIDTSELDEDAYGDLRGDWSTHDAKPLRTVTCPQEVRVIATVDRSRRLAGTLIPQTLEILDEADGIASVLVGENGVHVPGQAGYFHVPSRDVATCISVPLATVP